VFRLLNCVLGRGFLLPLSRQTYTQTGEAQMVIERVGVIGQTVLMAPYHKVGGNTDHHYALTRTTVGRIISPRQEHRA
jgi:hypothetical protein